jgi:hypothetical protein
VVCVSEENHEQRQVRRTVRLPKRSTECCLSDDLVLSEQVRSLQQKKEGAVVLKQVQQPILHLLLLSSLYRQ